MNRAGRIAAVEQESISNYKDSLSQAMEMLARDSRVLFLGQGVCDKGTFMSQTLENIPINQRLELPVLEECQMGMSIGLALNGFVPVSIYPRFNFLILAMNQLVNHLDKMKPHVIVRVGVGSTKPLDPGEQHKGDFTKAFQLLMPNTHIVRLEHAAQVIPEYQEALYREGPTILVEIADRY